MDGIFFLKIIGTEIIVLYIFIWLLAIDGIYHEKPPITRKPKEIKLRGDNYPFD